MEKFLNVRRYMAAEEIWHFLHRFRYPNTSEFRLRPMTCTWQEVGVGWLMKERGTGDPGEDKPRKKLGFLSFFSYWNGYQPLKCCHKTSWPKFMQYIKVGGINGNGKLVSGSDVCYVNMRLTFLISIIRYLHIHAESASEGEVVITVCSENLLTSRVLYK